MLSSSSYCGAFSSYIFSCVRTWKSIGFHLDPWLLSSTYVVPWFIDKFRLSWSRGGGKCCLKEKATARGTRPQLVVKIRHQERIVFLGEYPIVFNGKKALGELLRDRGGGSSGGSCNAPLPLGFVHLRHPVEAAAMTLC